MQRKRKRLIVTPGGGVSDTYCRVVDPNPDPENLYVFWASRIWIRYDLYGSGSGSFHQQLQKLQKPLISTIFL